MCRKPINYVSCCRSPRNFEHPRHLQSQQAAHTQHNWLPDLIYTYLLFFTIVLNTSREKLIGESDHVYYQLVLGYSCSTWCVSLYKSQWRETDNFLFDDEQGYYTKMPKSCFWVLIMPEKRCAPLLSFVREISLTKLTIDTIAHVEERQTRHVAAYTPP